MRPNLQHLRNETNSRKALFRAQVNSIVQIPHGILHTYNNKRHPTFFDLLLCLFNFLLGFLALLFGFFLKLFLFLSLFNELVFISEINTRFIWANRGFAGAWGRLLLGLLNLKLWLWSIKQVLPLKVSQELLSEALSHSPYSVQMYLTVGFQIQLILYPGIEAFLTTETKRKCMNIYGSKIYRTILFSSMERTKWK